MTDQPDHVLSQPAAASKIEDILAWKHQITVPTHSIRSAVTDQDRVSGGCVPGLPFGIGQQIDTVTEDRTRGIQTSHGVETMLELWAAWLAWELDQSYDPRKVSHGAWLLDKLQTERGLTTLDQWPLFADELRQAWARVRALSGHAPKTRALCPSCRVGVLQSPAHDRRGYDDTATCTNPNCHTTIDYGDVEIAASFRATLRDPNIPGDYYLSIDQVKTIWPGIKADTLSKWVRRGHVHKHGDRYRLADINTRKWS